MAIHTMEELLEELRSHYAAYATEFKALNAELAVRHHAFTGVECGRSREILNQTQGVRKGIIKILEDMLDMYSEPLMVTVTFHVNGARAGINPDNIISWPGGTIVLPNYIQNLTPPLNIATGDAKVWRGWGTRADGLLEAPNDDHDYPHIVLPPGARYKLPRSLYKGDVFNFYAIYTAKSPGEM